jgi:mRNA-degrading endonuclease RelE of RelBE toxin-antitoxin system
VAERPPRPARYQLIFHPTIEADLEALDGEGLEAALAILEDLAHGRVTGKLLGDRHVSGNLTGLARVKFDLAGHRPPRFRLVYRPGPENHILEIIAIGRREHHAIYRAALRRLPPPRSPIDDDPDPTGIRTSKPPPT